MPIVLIPVAPGSALYHSTPSFQSFPIPDCPRPKFPKCPPNVPSCPEQRPQLPASGLSAMLREQVCLWVGASGTSLKLSKAARMMSCPPRTRHTAASSSSTRALVLGRKGAGSPLRTGRPHSKGGGTWAWLVEDREADGGTE